MKQHKWHKEIKAWADGEDIEFKALNGEWLYTSYPHWNSNDEYRIKPQPKNPQYLYFHLNELGDYFIGELDDYYGCKYIGKIKLEDTENE